MTSAQLDRIFGVQRVASTQTTVFGEQALSGTARDHAWVLGVAFNHDALAVGAVPGVGYTYNVPAISPGLGGTPITEVWAPLDGRTFNVGIRTNL